MRTTCHDGKIAYALRAVLLLACLMPAWAIAETPEQPISDKKGLSLEALEREVPKKKKSKRAAKAKKNPADQGEAIADNSTQSDERAQRQRLPAKDELVEAKIEALKAKLTEQEGLLSEAEIALAKEQSLETQTFDTDAYLSLSIFNSAPPQDYKLVRTEVFLDGALRPIAIGGKRHQGLPRNNEQIFFAPLKPGCHEIMVRAEYVRLKNDIIGRFFGVDRVEKLSRSQTFIAQSGQRVEIEIEGFEAQNTFVKLYRGPELRFNRSVRPNFLPGASLVSLDDVLKQGQVRIDYINEDMSNHELRQKSLSIDGLPILSDAPQDSSNLVFNAPLSAGKHTLNVTLLFTEKKRINGGPQYNFRLNFDRDFYVQSGQTTIVNLIGMPKGGFRSSPQESRYARATSRILSEDNPSFFPTMTCKALREQELVAERRKAAEQKAASKDLTPVEPPKAEEPVLSPDSAAEPKLEKEPEPGIPVPTPGEEPRPAPVPEAPEPASAPAPMPAPPPVPENEQPSPNPAPAPKGE